MARQGYRLWFGKCNDFNLHGVFSRVEAKRFPASVPVSA